MKLICNNCLSGVFMKRYGLQYETPFVWARIYPEDFCFLINQFTTLNFGSIKCKYCKDVPNHKCLPINKNSVAIQISNGPYIFYNHYKFDELAITPRIEIPDVFSAHNMKYAIIKYITRVKRMCASPDAPIWIYHSNTPANGPAGHEFDIVDTPKTVSQIIDALNKHQTYKAIIITQFDRNALSPASSNILLCNIKNPYISFDNIIKIYGNQILEFSNEHH